MRRRWSGDEVAPEQVDQDRTSLSIPRPPPWIFSLRRKISLQQQSALPRSHRFHPLSCYPNKCLALHSFLLRRARRQCSDNITINGDIDVYPGTSNWIPTCHNQRFNTQLWHQCARSPTRCPFSLRYSRLNGTRTRPYRPRSRVWRQLSASWMSTRK